ncbi:MAG: ankyrin repeat domain-containing protein [Puniceicoccales bacterium]|jgi:hypothetical protein|nr:ankyrin repeat domain-containing protein [Puniceicoccales bacterium]
MLRSLLIFKVFFLALFSCPASAEFISEAEQEREAILLNKAERYALGIVPENEVENHSLQNEFKVQKLSESSGELRKAWHYCHHALTHHMWQKDGEACQAVQTSLDQHPELIYLTDGDGRNLLMNAVQMNRDEGVIFLLPYYEELLDFQDFCGDSALFIAIQNRNKYIAALLLISGARIDICDRNGFNVLQFSCTLENLEMFYFLESFLEKLDELKKLMATKNQA